jgi:hypothetical protein
MTAILGHVRSGFALLAMDSTATLTHADGRVTYDARESIPFRALPSGFAACSGSAEGAWASLDALSGTEGLTVDEADPRVRERLRDVPDAALSGDGALHLLTVASGSPELAALYYRGEVVRVPVGGQTFQAPVGMDRAAAIDLFHAWEREAQGTSGFDRIRSIARLFAELAERAPSVSGTLRLGLLQRPPGSEWTGYYLVHPSSELRTATDARILELLTPCESLTPS